MKVHFDDDAVAEVKFHRGSVYAHIDETNLYCLELETPVTSAMVVATTGNQNVQLWHTRLGHPGRSVFNALFRYAEWPLTAVDLRVDESFSCESCVKGKLTRKSFHSTQSVAS